MRGSQLSRFLPLFLLLLAAASPVNGSRRPHLRFVRTTELPGIGLQVRLMPDAVAQPAPPPTVYTYQVQRGPEQWKVEMFAPRELWFLEQHSGTWTDKYANSLSLVSLLRPEPGPFARKHVLREEYERARGKLPGNSDEWEVDDVRDWLRAYHGAPDVQLTRIPRHTFRLSDLYIVKTAGRSRHDFVFRINRRSAGQHRAARHWFYARFDVNAEIDADKARVSILTGFFDTLKANARPSSGSAGPSETFQDPAAPRNGAETGAMALSRRQVAASISNMKNWWYAETPNYVLLSNLTTRHRSTMRDLQTNLELLRLAYTALVPARVPVTNVSVIRVFATGTEFTQYVGPAYSWTGGLWMPDKRELVIRPTDRGGSREKRAGVLRATYHEAFHQYLFYALDYVQAPAWFNEGHATLFETAEIRNGSLVIDEDEGRLRPLLAVLESGHVPLRELVRMSYPDFYAGADEHREKNYALAWGTVYYLRKAAPFDRTSKYGSLLDRFCDALWASRSPDRATTEVFAGLDTEQLAAEMSAFWLSRNRRSTARRVRLFKPVDRARR